MIYLESDHQKAFVEWTKHPLVLKKYPELEMLYCNHNTQLLTIIQARRWKSLGGKAGIPDLFLPVARNEYYGLYIEMKSPGVKSKTGKGKGGLSDKQIEYFGKLRNQGYKVDICYEMKGAIKSIEQYLL